MKKILPFFLVLLSFTRSHAQEVLTDYEFTLVSLTIGDTEYLTEDVGAATSITLQFFNDNVFESASFCDFFAGDYTLEGETINLSPTSVGIPCGTGEEDEEAYESLYEDFLYMGNPFTFEFAGDVNKTFTLTSSTGDVAFFTARNLSLEEYRLNKQLRVFPNPAREQITILGLDQIEQVRLFALRGQEIQIDPLSTEIDLSQLAAGVYFLKIEAEGFSFTRKFVKN